MPGLVRRLLTRRPGRPAPGPRCRPMLEDLEGRDVPNAAYGAVAEFTGSRAAQQGTLALGGREWRTSSLQWAVADNGDGTFGYTYTFRNMAPRAISHVTLDLDDADVSGDRLTDPGVVTAFRINGTLSTALEFGNFDGVTGAVKFDVGPGPTQSANVVTYSFVSNRPPVYGDVFVKGGGGPQGNSAFNTGFGDQTFEDVLRYVARPGAAVAPVLLPPDTDDPGTGGTETPPEPPTEPADPPADAPPDPTDAGEPTDPPADPPVSDEPPPDEEVGLPG